MNVADALISAAKYMRSIGNDDTALDLEVEERIYTRDTRLRYNAEAYENEINHQRSGARNFENRWHVVSRMSKPLEGYGPKVGA